MSISYLSNILPILHFTISARNKGTAITNLKHPNRLNSRMGGAFQQSINERQVWSKIRTLIKLAKSQKLKEYTYLILILKVYQTQISIKKNLYTTRFIHNTQQPIASHKMESCCFRQLKVKIIICHITFIFSFFLVVLKGIV